MTYPDTRVWTAVGALLTLAVLSGCGGADPTGPVNSLNDGGVGNQSLLVLATVDVRQVTGGFNTQFRVTVSDRDGAAVSGADVVIEGDFSPLRLGEEGSAGSYGGERVGAASGTLRLRVEKDGMFVRDVTLGNIGIHAFLAPQSNDTVEAGVPLTIRWVSDAEAPVARLSTRDATFNNLRDQGTFVVPEDSNPPRSNQRFELIRSNEVQISGGLRGSYFRLEVRRSVEPVVVMAGG